MYGKITDHMIVGWGTKLMVKIKRKILWQLPIMRGEQVKRSMYQTDHMVRVCNSTQN